MKIKTLLVILLSGAAVLYIGALGMYNAAAPGGSSPSGKVVLGGVEAALRAQVLKLQAEVSGVPDLQAKVRATEALLENAKRRAEAAEAAVSAAEQSESKSRAAAADEAGMVKAAEARAQTAEARARTAEARARVAETRMRTAKDALASQKAAEAVAAGAAKAVVQPAAGGRDGAAAAGGCPHNEPTWCSVDLPRTAAGAANAKCVDAMLQQCPCACKGAPPTVHLAYEIKPGNLRGKTLTDKAQTEEAAAARAKMNAGDNNGAATVGNMARGGQALLYLYPAQFHAEQEYSYFYDEIWRALERSPRRTADAAKADVFFLGSEHACEFNWPNYTHSPPSVDFIYGDMNSCRSTRQMRTRQYLAKYARYLTGPGTDRPQKAGAPVHVIFDMFGYTMKDAKLEPNPQIAWAAPSFDMNEAFNIGRDIGFPAKNLVSFDKLDNPPISCSDEKKYLLTFKGTIDAEVRGNVAKLHNGKDIQIITSEFKTDCGQKIVGDVEHICGGGVYDDLMTHTTFGAVMRGDNLYSYRYLEVMSGGAIPVIFSDTWVLPFYEVVDYSKFAIVLHERDWEQLVPMLRAMPAEKVCSMRKEALRVYRKHFADFDAIMETTMALFDARKAGTTLKPPIDWRAEEQ